ncbi:hypothetical protein [Streptomyces sp. st77]|uniref:hypothetical protein n=1 Tax=Streptomyces sp. st77 TaxID=1828074 RepID=UPI000BFDC4A5|nr:hypothetical protein [Streptomyces sp. st77]
MASKPLFRFGTYNLLDLEIPRTTEHKQRSGRLVAGSTAAYRGRTGMLGAQELLGDTQTPLSSPPARTTWPRR